MKIGAVVKTVVIAGASGFIGTHFRRQFADAGWRVRTVGRSGDAVWGDTAAITAVLDGADLLLNLAGKSVSCRYTPANTAEIIRSRNETTAELGRAVAACAQPPRDWFNASTGTIYRDARDYPQDEYDGELGSGFSVDVARGWEETLAAAEAPKTRRIPLRITIVLGSDGGVMRPFNNLARLGLGGRMGDGGQKFSWVHVEDVFRAVLFLHEHREITGPVNIAAPEVVTNAALMSAVRRTNRAPLGLPTPAWLLTMGAVLIRTETELVLKSRWVAAKKLQDAGFSWKHPDLNGALANAKADRFSMSYGVPALLLGWLCTFALFCLGLALTAAVSPLDTGLGWYFLPVALIYGFPVAVVLGLPLAILIAWPLRRVRNQRLHVLAFAAVLGSVMAALLIISSRGEMLTSGTSLLIGLGLVALVAGCGALGRASVMNLVERRNPELEERHETDSMCLIR